METTIKEILKREPIDIVGTTWRAPSGPGYISIFEVTELLCKDPDRWSFKGQWLGFSQGSMKYMSEYTIKWTDFSGEPERVTMPLCKVIDGVREHLGIPPEIL